MDIGQDCQFHSYFFLFLSCTESFPGKMKITAILTVPQGFCPGEGHFLQAAVSYIVSIAEDVAQLRAVVLDAGGVPEAFCDSHIERISGVTLSTIMQVGGAHDLPENAAVKEEKSRAPLHFCHGGVHICSDDSKHIFLQIRGGSLLGKAFL